MKELTINMFGVFTISYGDNKVTELINRKKKVWSLLEYLITFRSRDISQKELIELLWPEDNVDDPANTLKTLMHRVRSVIKHLGFEDAKNLIVAKGGSYAWNLAVPCVIDVDVFEKLLNNAYASGVKQADKLAMLLEASEMYKGDFLLKDGTASWIVPISTYYRSKYIKAVSDACGILSELNRYDKIVDLCQKAVMVDSYEEYLHYNLVNALIKEDKLQQALSYYNYVKDLFYRKFGINLSDEFKSLYKDLVRSYKVIENDLSIIMENLREVELINGCFYCEYEFFKDIYRLEIRSAERTGQTVYMCLLTVSGKSGGLPSQRTLNNSMDSLKAIAMKTLRRGDVFTRYSVSQYLLMLPMTTYESATRVIDRIVHTFKQKNAKSQVVLIYSHQAISPMGSSGSVPFIGNKQTSR